MTQRLTFYTLVSSTLAISLLSSPLAIAAEPSDVPLPDQTPDQASELLKREDQTVLLNNTVPSAKVSDEEVQKALARNQRSRQSTGYNLEALKADPLAFTKYLNDAIAAQDMQTVKELLPHYKELEVKDPMLINFADALVYRSEGENKKAIAIYKQMLAADPDFNPVRLNMAQALYADKQYAAAEDQLLKLQSADLPAPVMKTVQSLLSRIQKSEKWQFNASASYIHDDNLNDVPAKKMQAQLGKTLDPEAGNGIQASASATKRFNLTKNYYATVGANASIKGFWDASDYNDYLFTGSAGVGYADARNDVSVTPFVTKRIYDEAPYSLRKGVTLQGSRWVKPKLKLSATGILSNETFDDERNKNRETDGSFMGLNALYTKDAKQYFYGGLGTYRNDVPKSSILSYDRNSINIGWGREWKQGISTLASIGYSVKDYDDPADTYDKSSVGYIGYYNSVGATPGTLRTDKTTSLGLQVWKRDLTFYGLTPRLVLDYDKSSSTFPYYDDRDEKSATIMLTKTF